MMMDKWSKGLQVETGESRYFYGNNREREKKQGEIRYVTKGACWLNGCLSRRRRKEALLKKKDGNIHVS